MAVNPTAGGTSASKSASLPIDRDDLIQITYEAHQVARAAGRALRNAGLELTPSDVAGLKTLAAATPGKLRGAQRRSLSKLGLITEGKDGTPDTLTAAGRTALTTAEKAFDPLLQATQSSTRAVSKSGVRSLGRIARQLRKGTRSPSSSATAATTTKAATTTAKT